MSRYPQDCRYVLALAVLVAGCESTAPTPISEDAGEVPILNPGINLFSAIPIHELDSTYFGLPGYYFDGSNQPPAEHVALGHQLGTLIEPLATDGTPLDASLGGRIVFLSIGTSNTMGKWCMRKSYDGVTCNSWSLIGKWKASAQLRQAGDGVFLFNGATSGGNSTHWDDPADPQYNKVESNLVAQGLHPLQVQAVAVEPVLAGPTVSLPSDSADMYQLTRIAANQIRALKVRYPNLRQVFISPRDYAGHSKVASNPEPYAYETGYTVKRLVQAQITQLATGVMDSLAGDLDLSVAPWITWGPYLWGTATPRADGLFWVLADYDPKDGSHFSKQGEIKAANYMLSWFSNSTFSGCWLLRGFTCTAAGASGPQYARPVSLVANTGWRGTTGTELWDMIDEDLSDDGTTMVATPVPPATSPGNSFTVGLALVTDPGTSAGHVIHVRGRKPLSGKRIDGRVELLQGGTVMASYSINNLATSTWTTYSYTLSAAQADAITDYAGLELRITMWSTGTGTNRLGSVTQAYLEVPGL